MTECVVSGNLKTLTGFVVVDSAILFERDVDIYLFEGSIRKPSSVYAYTNSLGDFSVPLIPGNYTVTVSQTNSPKTFLVVVPELASVNIRDIITPTPAEIDVITPLVAQAEVYSGIATTQAGAATTKASEASASADVAAGYALFPTVGQRRGRINYNTTTSLRVDGLPDQIAMGGFRFMGNYLKSRGRLVSTGLGLLSHKVVSISSDLSGLTSPKLDCWYGVFFCTNTSDTVGSFKLVPYFRTLSRSGNTITLAKGGENQNTTPSAETFVHPDNVWAGVECLVVNQGGVWSGRRTTITSNTATTITLADATGIGPLDFILPAPVGFTDYHYLGSAYYESPGEWRNIADSGVAVGARMVTVSEVPLNGAAANVKIRFGGNISPLATGFTGRYNATSSSGSTGNVSEILSHDSSNHDTWQVLATKPSTSNIPLHGMIDQFSFSSEQAAWMTTGGTLPSTIVSRSILIYGWVEP